MGKTDKADKKVKKCDKKTSKKCGVMLAFLAMAASLILGCAQTGSQPSRSQTLNNDFKNCVVIIASKATVSNECVSVEGGHGSANEIFTQTMKNEGAEQNTPTSSPTQTTRIEPKTDVNTTGGRTAGVLDSLVGSFGTWLTTPSGKEAAANAAASAKSTDGSCTDGACSDN